MASKSCVDMALPCGFRTGTVAAGGLVCLQCGAQRWPNLVCGSDVGSNTAAIGFSLMAIVIAGVTALFAAWWVGGMLFDVRGFSKFFSLLIAMGAGIATFRIVASVAVGAIADARASKVRWERGGHAVEVDLKAR